MLDKSPRLVYTQQTSPAGQQSREALEMDYAIRARVDREIIAQSYRLRN
jgi:hypothetical protein